MEQFMIRGMARKQNRAGALIRGVDVARAGPGR